MFPLYVLVVLLFFAGLTPEARPAETTCRAIGNSCLFCCCFGSVPGFTMCGYVKVGCCRHTVHNTRTHAQSTAEQLLSLVRESAQRFAYRPQTGLLLGNAVLCCAVDNLLCACSFVIAFEARYGAPCLLT